MYNFYMAYESLRHPDKGGYTGRMLEADVLVSCRKDEGWDKYMKFNEALNWVKDHQPPRWDPTDPETRIANDLHALVAEELGLDDYLGLLFYTAVGSPLDRFHGIDGFFECGGKRVTIDVTQNPNKTTYKADYVVRGDELLDGAGKSNVAVMKQLAKDITSGLR